MSSPLLYQLVERAFGMEPSKWTVGDYAMGLSSGPLKGPKVNIPSALQKALGMFGEAPMKTEAQWTGLNRPWSGIYKGGLAEGRTTPSPGWKGSGPVWELGSEVPPPGGSPLTPLQRILQNMGPAADLNTPDFLRNAEFFKRLTGGD